MVPLTCPGDLVKLPEIEVITEPCPRASAPEAVGLEAEALHEPTAKQPWELEEINQSLRNRDKLKDDAISQLSDQLVALSTRVQEIERKQQLLT